MIMMLSKSLLSHFFLAKLGLFSVSIAFNKELLQCYSTHGEKDPLAVYLPLIPAT